MPETRRFSPLLIATISIAVLYIASAVALGTPPGASDSGATIVGWLRDHGDNVRLALWFTTLLAVPLGVYIAIVRDRLPAVYRDVFTIGATALIATAMVQAWFIAGMAWHADQLQPATARTLLDIASYWGPVLTGATMLMLGPVALLALRGEAGLPRWLGYIVGVTFLEQLVETITVFGKDGFTAPGGPMNLMLGAGLFIVSMIAIGIALSRLAGADLGRTT
ncbi:MAG: hypothetical protein H0W70_12325 [Actinobacteria bacterium]|nr:hypothetical protein [Actinomycetota bacterium]